jgi:hypothetical protein
MQSRIRQYRQNVSSKAARADKYFPFSSTYRQRASPDLSRQNKNQVFAPNGS